MRLRRELKRFARGLFVSCVLMLGIYIGRATVAVRHIEWILLGTWMINAGLFLRLLNREYKRDRDDFVKSILFARDRGEHGTES